MEQKSKRKWRLGMERKKWIIGYFTLLHWIWGAALLSSYIPLGVTAISAILSFGLVAPYTAGIYFLLVSGLAMIGAFAPWPVGVLFLIPQTLTIWLSAYGVAHALLQGSFVDGVVRPISFLICDQAPTLLAPLFQGAAIISLLMEEHEPKVTQFKSWSRLEVQVNSIRRAQ